MYRQATTSDSKFPLGSENLGQTGQVRLTPSFPPLVDSHDRRRPRSNGSLHSSALRSNGQHIVPIFIFIQLSKHRLWTVVGTSLSSAVHPSAESVLVLALRLFITPGWTPKYDSTEEYSFGFAVAASLYAGQSRRLRLCAG